ncbi:hypothetical protein [Catellatospora sp. NPDC049133]
MIFPEGVVFVCARGDPPARRAAERHGLGLGNPAEQLDWAG